MGRVVIGMDPHKRSATIEVLDEAEQPVMTGRFGTHWEGYRPSGAARLLGDIGDVSRFPTKAHFASWNGTAPLDASSGEQTRHRLSRAGNRRINRTLHIMAVVQLRHPTTEGRRYYDRRLAEGKTPMEAMRALKRRLSDVVYQKLVNDQKHQRASDAEQDPQADRTGPEEHLGGGYEIQRGRLEPQHRRFGQVTFRARQDRRYPTPGPSPDRTSRRSRRR